MPKRKLIYEGWNQYAEHVLPSNCSDVQRRETRQAFYAGAAHLWESFIANLDTASSDETPADLSLAEGVQDEIDRFKRDLLRGSR